MYGDFTTRIREKIKLKDGKGKEIGVAVQSLFGIHMKYSMPRNLRATECGEKTCLLNDVKSEA